MPLNHVDDRECLCTIDPGECSESLPKNGGQCKIRFTGVQSRRGLSQQAIGNISFSIFAVLRLPSGQHDPLGYFNENARMFRTREFTDEEYRELCRTDKEEVRLDENPWRARVMDWFV